MQWWAHMDLIGLAKNTKKSDKKLAFVHSSPLVWSHPHLLDLSSYYQIMLAPIYVLLIFLIAFGGHRMQSSGKKLFFIKEI